MTSNPTPHELAEERTRPVNYSTGKVRRTSTDKMFGGICKPIADLVKIDVNIVRIVAVVLAFVTSGVAALVYLAAWAILPADDGNDTLLDNLIENGKQKYSDYQNTKAKGQPSSQSGPAPRDNGETFNPYAD